MPDKPQNAVGADLDGRLDCFGEFNLQDAVCKNCCALAVNCAVTKVKYLSVQVLDDVVTPSRAMLD
jgi:hypothetical protein